MAATRLPANRDEVASRLQRAYPEFVAGISENEVLFADGTTLPFDDGIANKPDKDWISNPDIDDMFAYRYPPGARSLVPRPFCWPITMQAVPLKRASPPTMLRSSA